MHANIVPIVTYSSQATATNLDLLRHFGLDSNATFCVDTNVVFSSPEGEISLLDTFAGIFKSNIDV